jgi:hypothetical protein
MFDNSAQRFASFFFAVLSGGRLRLQAMPPEGSRPEG